MSSTYTIGMASNLDSFASSAPASGTPPELFFYFLFVTYETLPAAPQFAISQITADKKARRASSGPLPSVLAFQQRDLFPRAPGNPTAAVILQAKPLPGSLVRVEITSPAARSPEDFDFSPDLNQGQVTLALRRDQPPRLSVAMNTTFVARPTAPGNFGAPGVAEIKAVLGHIHRRLLDGPAAAWRGSDGSPELPFGPGTRDSDEESWSKLITEMLIAAPYGLPSTLYLRGEAEDPFLLKYLDDADPGYPICYECQQLVTMAALTRGIFQTSKSKRTLLQFTAGDGSSGTVKQLGGRFLPASSVASVGDAIAAGITPGSSWVYNGFGKDGKEVGNQGGAHIGFAVRVDLTGKRIQTFDTGGLNVKPRNTPLEAGTFDDPWVNATAQVPGPHVAPEHKAFKGVCVLAAPNLAQALERMRRARPLGFARLVLLRRVAAGSKITSADIRFAGPLLRMHHDGSDGPRNLSYAAYLWSLRDHPGAGQLQATWLFYTPRGALTDVMLHGSSTAPTTSARQLTPSAMVRAARIKTAPDHRLAEAYGIADHASQSDGTVTVVRRFDQHNKGGLKPSERPEVLDKLPWGTRSGTVRLADGDLDDLPYFKNG